MPEDNGLQPLSNTPTQLAGWNVGMEASMLAGERVRFLGKQAAKQAREASSSEVHS